uniref:Uncharacterized protein n=1 Tax=Anguilla anguilla TaxID=7936 RepID=A0A0E9S7S3_ANGAN
MFCAVIELAASTRSLTIYSIKPILSLLLLSKILESLLTQFSHLEHA